MNLDISRDVQNLKVQGYPGPGVSTWLSHIPQVGMNPSFLRASPQPKALSLLPGSSTPAVWL